MIRGLVALLALTLSACITPVEPLSRAELEARYTNDASKFTELPGGERVHYRIEGNPEGETLVLVHGSLSSLHVWDNWVAVLSPHFRIVRFDLPAHGLTGPSPSVRYRPEDAMNFMEELTEALDLDQFYLAGNSLGGQITWRYGLAHPEKVKGMILLAPSGAPRRLSAPLEAARAVKWVPGIQALVPDSLIPGRDEVRSAAARAYYDPGLLTENDITRKWELVRLPGQLKAFADAAADWPFTDREAKGLKETETPILVIWGQGDRVIPVQGADWFRENVPAARVIIYDRTGHVPQKEAAKRSARDTRDFILASEWAQGRSQ